MLIGILQFRTIYLEAFIGRQKSTEIEDGEMDKIK